jgi:predicted esterase
VVPAEASRVAADVLQSLDVPVELLLSRDLGHSIDPEGIAAGARLLQEAFSMV